MVGNPAWGLAPARDCVGPGFSARGATVRAAPGDGGRSGPWAGHRAARRTPAACGGGRMRCARSAARAAGLRWDRR